MKTRQRRIYFSGSIRGGREDQEVYAELIAHLARSGVVLTEQVGDKALTTIGEDDLSDPLIYERDCRAIRDADLLVAEVTTPSLGVGYEIAVAEQRGIPILCLHTDRPGYRLSAMIAGNPRLTVRRYQNLLEATAQIDRFLRSIGETHRDPGAGVDRD